MEVLGHEEAMTLIEELPGEQPATRQDLTAAEGRLQDRMNGLQRRMDSLEARMTSLEARMDRLELRMDHLEARMDNLELGLRDLREDLMAHVDARIEGAEGRLLAAMHSGLGEVRTDLASQTRTFVLSQLGMLVTLAALAFTALRIV